MFTRFKEKCVLAFSILAVTSCAYASQLPCPAIGMMQKAAHKIDKAHKKEENTYIVFTSHPAFQENKFAWYINVENIVAESPQEAKRLAKEEIKNTSFQININAKKSEGYYSCYYGPAPITATGVDHFAQNRLSR